MPKNQHITPPGERQLLQSLCDGNLGKFYRIFLIFRLSAADLTRMGTAAAIRATAGLFLTDPLALCEGGTMHRDFHARFLLYWIAIGGLLLTGSGCSFVKVPQGWVLSTGWSLEFHRMPFHVSRERACETGCEVGCTPGCGSNDASPTGESNEPAAAPVPIEPAPTLRKIEEGPAPEVDESAGLMDLLRRRGRLGVCTTCGKMGRFKGSQSPPHPAVQSTMPVVAKFHPVPAAPVFCPQPNAVVARPASFSPPPSKIQPGYNRRMPLPPQPEFVPPPPPAPGDTKYEQAPRELDVPPEPPEWVFTTPRERSEGTSESPSQSKRLGESSTRR